MHSKWHFKETSATLHVRHLCRGIKETIEMTHLYDLSPFFNDSVLK
jgi:hypothetical protein